MEKDMTLKSMETINRINKCESIVEAIEDAERTFGNNSDTMMVSGKTLRETKQLLSNYSELLKCIHQKMEYTI